MKDCSASKSDWTISRKPAYHPKSFRGIWYPALSLLCAIQSSVNLCVRFYHTALWEAFEDASSSAASNCRRKRRIIKKTRYLPGKVLGIPHAKRKTSITQNFGEPPNI